MNRRKSLTNAVVAVATASVPVVAVPAEPYAAKSHGGYTDAEITEMGRKLAYDYLESSGWFDRQRSGMEAPK